MSKNRYRIESWLNKNQIQKRSRLQASQETIQIMKKMKLNNYLMINNVTH